MNEPAERTAMAWSRTSFAFLGSGAVLMFKHLPDAVGPKAAVPAALSGAVALATWVIAIRRQRTLRQDPLPVPLAPRRQVYFIGIAVLVLTVVVSVTQLV